MMQTIKIYTTPTCGVCRMAKKKMQDKNTAVRPRGGVLWTRQKRSQLAQRSSNNTQAERRDLRGGIRFWACFLLISPLVNAEKRQAINLLNSDRL